MKVAKHHHRDETVDPETYDRVVSPADEALIRGLLADYLPGRERRDDATPRTCLYTMTPDGDFIIDRLPGTANIIVASPCSGHGFKFAPVIGEILCGPRAARTRRRTTFPVSAWPVWITPSCADDLLWTSWSTPPCGHRSLLADRKSTCISFSRSRT